MKEKKLPVVVALAGNNNKLKKDTHHCLLWMHPTTKTNEMWKDKQLNKI
jgi:hypothetical protein